MNPAQVARGTRRKPESLPRVLRVLCAKLIVPACLLILAPPVCAANKAELEALHGRIQTLKKNLRGAEENRAEASDALRASERGVSEANRALHDIGVKQRAARADLARIGAQSRSLEADIASQRRELGQLLAMRYASGRQSYLRLLLSGQDPNRTARELRYYGYISRAQADSIRALRSNLAGLAQLEREARGKNTELAELETQQREARKELLAQQKARRLVLARLASKIHSQRRRIASLERDEARLSRLVDKLGTAASPRSNGPRNDKLPQPGHEGVPFSSLKGKLRLPIRGELMNRFGGPRSGGRLRWKGLFIRGTSGEQVRAVAAGRVVFADWMRGFGNLLIIDHGQGYLTIYGDNEALLKKVGDKVAAGDVVATVGNSGGNPVSGLYFEIRYRGKAFDPMKWASLK